MTSFIPKLPDALKERRRRRNVRALARYLALVAAIVVAYSALFLVIMARLTNLREDGVSATAGEIDDRAASRPLSNRPPIGPSSPRRLCGSESSG
jgi:hypothetical protein